MLCPKDHLPCCDDLCHGGGCMEMEGYAMLAECDACGGLIDEEIPDLSTCTCDDIENYDYMNEMEEYEPEPEPMPISTENK